ncbi:hypothetical protein GGR51DRAFT_570368 [Nemania sp. FL0031]|nr:hypothetical protein GGR51DRAFT_570368 [Nemania sp. FL0031]
MAIARLTSQCLDALDAFDVSLLWSKEADDQMVRFNTWISRNSVFATDPLSLDYKLREAPIAQDMIVARLSDLETKLLRLRTAQSSHSHPPLIPTVLGEAPSWDEIVTVISELIEISTEIRTITISEDTRAARYTQYDESGLVDLSAKFKSLAGEYLYRAWPNIDQGLRERLRDTMSKRQRMLAYYKARKSASTSDKSEVANAPYRRSAARPSERAGSRATATERKTSRISVNTYHAPPSPASSSEDTRFMDGETDVKPIQPPPEIPKDAIELECEYCCLVYPVSEFRGRPWARHCLRDLAPYFCIMESCDSPTLLFASKENWHNHMREKHREEVWACLSPEHNETLRYDDRQALCHHLQSDHDGEFFEDELDDIADQCLSFLPRSPLFRDCPICGELFHQGSSYAQEVNTINHIADHLHSFAQISLDWLVDESGNRGLESPVSSTSESIHPTTQDVTDLPSDLDDFDEDDLLAIEPIRLTIAPQKNDNGWTRRADVLDDRCRSLLFLARIDQIIHGTDKRGGNPTTLIIFEFRFHGLNGHRRLKEAVINVTFRDEEGHYEFDPEVISLSPCVDFTLDRPNSIQKDCPSSPWGGVEFGTDGSNVGARGHITLKSNSRQHDDETNGSLLTGIAYSDYTNRKRDRNNAMRLIFSENSAASPGLITGVEIRAAVLLRRIIDNDLIASVQVKPEAWFTCNAMQEPKRLIAFRHERDPFIFVPRLNYLPPGMAAGVLGAKVEEAKLQLLEGVNVTTDY